MRVITYLGFTLLSIMIQFSVMDFIFEQPQADKKPLNSNITSNRKLFRDILQEYSNKPHALYYRTGLNHLKEYKNMPTTKKYSNISVTEDNSESTTAESSTLFEVYDESVSMNDIETTTDSFYSSTEFDNVTEFVLFEKKNNTINRASSVPKRTFTKEICDCNFLFKVCDINCCCDIDCSETELSLFVNCEEGVVPEKQNTCYPQSSVKAQTSTSLTHLFCIAKTNLPEKRNKNKYDPEMATRNMEMTLKWQKTKSRNSGNIKFMKKLYSPGDPIWLLKNGSIHYLDVSSPVVNNYCTDRKMIKFLEEERIDCNVQLADLEMIQILKTVEESMIISATDRTSNASTLNCSNVHCTNWSLIICDEASCTAYNKTVHEPFCTDTKCTHIALKIDFMFYYHDLKIENATIKLFIQNVSMILPVLVQEINVRFFLANVSVEDTVQLSGAPGYIIDLPVIVSYVDINHTDYFFNTTSQKNRLILPTNRNGKCIISSTAKNVLQFGTNKRTKCLLSLAPKYLSYNGTHACKMIHDFIEEYLGINNPISVSPNGNPLGQTDKQWLLLEVQAIEKETIYGEFFDGKSTLVCSNIVTDIFFIFTYADQSQLNDKVENKILTAMVQRTGRNVTLNVDDSAVVLTVDTSFIDVTKPPVYEFAGKPDLNIHLPADFFFPFPNRAFVSRCNILLCICGIVFIKIK